MSNIIEVISHSPEGARITKLRYGVGVPVHRLRLLVEKLCRLGLAGKATDGEGVYYGVTPRGMESLDIFWKTKSVLEEPWEPVGA